MKTYTLLFLFAIVSSANAQELVVGQYTEVDLAENIHFNDDEDECHDYEVDFALNAMPYATGMSLYLSLDSLSGNADSIEVFREGDINHEVMYPPVLIPVESTEDLKFYYLGSGTLFLSVKAMGTPEIAGENYFCQYSQNVLAWADGCNMWGIEFTGGEGSMDTDKSCQVQSTSSVRKWKKPQWLLYPNPVENNIQIELDSAAEIFLMDLTGSVIYSQSFAAGSHWWNAPIVPEGIYVIKAQFEDGHVRSKRVIFTGN